MDSRIAVPIKAKKKFSDSLIAIRYRPNYYLYFLDIVALPLISLAGYLLFRQHIGDDIPTTWLLYGCAVAIAMLAYSFFGFSNDLYDWRMFRQHLKAPFATFGGVLFAFGILLLLGFLFRITEEFSRLWLLFWLAGFSVYILSSRFAMMWYLSQPSQKSSFRRQAIILGASENGQEVLDHMIRFDDQDIQVIGFLDDRQTRLPPSYRGVPVLGGTHLAKRLIREHGVNLIIVALPWKARERIEGLLQQFSSWCVDVYLAPDKLGLRYADRPVYRVGGMHVLSLQDRPISEWDAVVKRIEDLCLVIPAITLLSPLLAIVALAIKLESKGDVFFIQERFGFNDNLIKVYKFRSMYTDMTDRRGEQQTVKDDPRITRVGRIIRKTSIDELPQLFNVLLGSMSIVGPRPHPTGMQSEGQLLHELLQGYASRHRVKPGLTGWAQCNGWRGETDTRDKLVNRVEHDLYYIENWSIFLDILVIFKTVFLLFKDQENAY